MRLPVLLRRFAAILTLASASGVTTTSTASASGSEAAALPSDESAFSFDGTTSDIAQQLYWRSKANDSATTITLTSVPDAITQRLSPLGINFNADLTGIEQRAVMWDTGFVLAPSGTDALQIWTLNNYSLTDIAVPYDDYSGAGCVALECNSTDLPSYNTSQYCNGAQMLSKARCVIESFEDAGEGGYSMWSNGGDPDMVPHIRVINHYWTDTSSGISYQVYGVHTLSQDDEPTYAVCSSTGYGSLIIPCFPSTNSSANSTGTMQAVSPSAWVTTWLMEQHSSNTSGADSDDGFNLILLAPIIGGVLVLAALVAGCWWHVRLKRRRKNYEDSHQIYLLGSPDTRLHNSAEDHYREVGTPSGNKDTDHTDPEDWRPTDSTEAGTLAGYRGTEGDQVHHIQRQFGSEGDDDFRGPDGLLRILTTDAYLVHKGISYDNLQFQSKISRGAYGEIWLCECNGQQVVAKRLIQNKQAMYEEIQDFVHEIQLSASLQHPNIVRVIGVAWNSLYNLSMVIDYLPTGDLQLYLKKQGDLMTWARDKIHIAVGIARALAYLHFRDPVLIHRDLKSKNVLLTRMLDPQLIDFGVSRRRIEETMTAGVGIPYWTAPEVLNGDRYSEQSDIYSFGVLLSELDTCELPYFDAVSPEGSKLKPFQVLKGVIGGVLRPSFSDSCPSRIRRLGVACLQQDPARRPDAQKLVAVLGG